MSSSIYVRTERRPPVVDAALLGQLDIELTERCQNACCHCNINRAQHDESARQRELDTAAWADLLTQAAALGARCVRFTGGEPLLREDFTDLYIYARRHGLRVMLFTNARAITPALVALFARIPPQEKIEVSVYGMAAKSYEAVSGAPGSFAEFQRGVELLRAYDIPFIIKGALLPQNRHEMAAMDAWAAAIPSMDHLPSYAMFFEYRARRDSAAANRRIESYRLSPEDGLAVLRREPERYDREMRNFCARFLKAPGDQLFSCGAAHGGGCVDAYGLLQPCLSVRHPDWTYDLRQGTLADGLRSLRARVEAAQAENPEYLARCARCFLKSLCQQCPGKSWMEHGTLDTPVDYLCRIAHVQARDLGLLAEGEHGWEVTDADERISRIQQGVER